jgi:hypothetical protein
MRFWLPYCSDDLEGEEQNEKEGGISPDMKTEGQNAPTELAKGNYRVGPTDLGKS